jgi:WD40 repeat protein
VDTDLTGGFCLSFSPSDHHLAIGLANGNVNVYSSSDLSFVKTIRRVGSASSKPAESAAKVSPLERLATHSKQAPSPSKQNSAVASASLRACDIKYSPAGDTLAVGFSDGQISIHDAKAEEFPLLGILKGHSGSINKFDFSRDGKHLQSSSTANELLYWDVKELQQITKTAELRDVEWSSWTVPFGWAMKGIWPAGVDGSHINAVARSNRGDLIASGDDDCVVKLFKFPSYDPKAQHRVYGGHSSHVTNVAFSFDDSALLSTGGQDCSLFLWKIVDVDSSTGSESSSVGSDLSNSRPASPAPGVPSSAPSSTAALRSLREMKDNGFISDDEFAKAEDILSTLSVKEKLIQLLAQPLSADTTPQLSSLLGGL